jgi:hypothetical protein
MPTSEPIFPARFDPDTWERDLARSTPAGRAAAEAAKVEYERDGVPRSHLKPCEPEGRDGTKLPDCAKTYIPRPDGKWGIVFKIVIAENRVRLEFISFGVRHHPKGSHALTTYDYASKRVAEITAKDLRGEKPDTPAE